MTESENIMKELKKPFPKEEIQWRVQSCGISNGRPWAIVLAYITSRAVMDRLDNTVGPLNWKDEINSLENGKTFCKLSLRIDDEWITKMGVAGETNIEAAKGGASDALKRSGVKWGIARYLYKLDEDFADCKKNKPNNWRNNGWRKAKTKDKKTIYWKEPNLPSWALPGGTTNNRNDREEFEKSIEEVGEKHHGTAANVEPDPNIIWPEKVKQKYETNKTKSNKDTIMKFLDKKKVDRISDLSNSDAKELFNKLGSDDEKKQ